jgi:hypothetical protein
MQPWSWALKENLPLKYRRSSKWRGGQRAAYKMNSDLGVLPATDLQL